MGLAPRKTDLGHRFPVVVAVLLLVAAVTVLGGTQPAIVIGVSNVQTGPSSALGKELMAGAMSYFELVNRAGGIHGREIRVILKDDRYEPDPAVQNTYDLITKDQVFLLFGYVGTPTLTRVLPLLKYFEAEEIVNVAPFTGAEPQRKPPYDKFVFNIRASYREETRALVDYLVGQGCRRIGFFGQADAYGKSGEVGTAEALGQHGLKLWASVTYRRNAPFETDMGPQVAMLRSRGVDAVVSVGVYGPCAGFIRDARLAGWDAPIANVSFVNARLMMVLVVAEEAKRKRVLATNLIQSSVVPWPEDTRFEVVRRYRERISKDEASAVSLEGWLNATVLVKALQRAGADATRKDFIQAMESLGDWDPGTGERLGFSRSSHQGMHRVWLTKVNRDSRRIIESRGIR